MRSNRIRLSCALLMVTCLALLPLEAQRRPRALEAGLGLPANTFFRLKLVEELNSRRSVVGDHFTAEVITPVLRQGTEIVPVGSIVSGRVTAVQRARSRSRAGYIAVQFTALKVSGAEHKIDGSLVEVVDHNSGRIDAEGRLKGRSATARDLVLVGGGAGGGALLGALVGSAGTGLVIGGVAGAATALIKKGNEAKVPRGTEVGMVLNRSITIPKD